MLNFLIFNLKAFHIINLDFQGNTYKIVIVKDDGTENEVKGTAYTDSNNHIIEKYEVEENNTKHKYKRSDS